MYHVEFGYRYVDHLTRRGFFGDLIPFSTYTVVEPFAETPDGKYTYPGLHAGGSY